MPPTLPAWHAFVDALSEVLPSGFRVASEDDEVVCYASDGLVASFWAGDVSEPSADPSVLVVAALRVLNAVQDDVTMTLRECWPRLTGPGHVQAVPGARIHEGQLVCWFGDETEPTLALRPIRLDGAGQ